MQVPPTIGGDWQRRGGGINNGGTYLHGIFTQKRELRGDLRLGTVLVFRPLCPGPVFKPRERTREKLGIDNWESVHMSCVPFKIIKFIINLVGHLNQKIMDTLGRPSEFLLGGAEY